MTSQTVAVTVAISERNNELLCHELVISTPDGSGERHHVAAELLGRLPGGGGVREL